MLDIRIHPLHILFILLILISCGSKENHLKAKIAETAEGNTSLNSKYDKITDGSFIEWRASHIGGIDPRRGKIYIQKANILVSNGEIKHASILVDMNKLEVEDLPDDAIVELAEHLKSEDFFDVKKYPSSLFEMTNLVTIQGEYNTEVTGNLTILDRSNSITFKSNITVGDSLISFVSENFSINRSKWGMTYNALGTLGVPLDYLISDDIGFTINVKVSK